MQSNEDTLPEAHAAVMRPRRCLLQRAAQQVCIMHGDHALPSRPLARCSLELGWHCMPCSGAARHAHTLHAGQVNTQALCYDAATDTP